MRPAPNQRFNSRFLVLDCAGPPSWRPLLSEEGKQQVSKQEG